MNNYLDFDLLISHEDGKYRARILRSPAGEATHDFLLPFKEFEVENFILRIGFNRMSKGVRRVDSPEVAAIKDFGGRLFSSVFDGEVRACLHHSLYEAARGHNGLRLRLRLSDVPELEDLPWEYLYNPKRNSFFTLSAETPLVRYLEMSEPIRTLQVEPPLRALVMISSPSDYGHLQVDREWETLRSSTKDLRDKGLLHLEQINNATLGDLRRHLQKTDYHIFHFIGHGSFLKDAQEGAILMTDTLGRGRAVSGQTLGTILRDRRTLRLVILNACEGARTARTDPFAGVAQSLVQSGIPAVIAMQFEITDSAAIIFAKEFFGTLAQGIPVDAALAEARLAIYADGNGLEWGTPVLYMRCDDGRIFNVTLVEKTLITLTAEAEKFMDQENWSEAIERWLAILRINPKNMAAAAALNRAQREQHRADVYELGQTQLSEQRWEEALKCFNEIGDTQNPYKDSATLAAQAESELNRARTTEIRVAIQCLIDTHEWSAAATKLQSLLNLYPHDEWAAQTLEKVRQELDLADMYEKGLQLLKSDQSEKAIEMFQRICAIRTDYRDVAALLKQAATEVREARITDLYYEAEGQIRRRNWDEAEASLKQLLEMDPAHEGARTKLKWVEKQRLAVDYQAGIEFGRACLWREALEAFERVRTADPGYKDITDHIAAVRFEIARENERHQERVRLDDVRSQIQTLYLQTAEAESHGNWPEVIEKYREIRHLDPDAVPAEKLAQAERQHSLSTLYDEVGRLLNSGDRAKAAEPLRRIVELQPTYRDVPELLAQLESEAIPVNEPVRRRLLKRTFWVLLAVGLLLLGIVTIKGLRNWSDSDSRTVASTATPTPSITHSPIPSPSATEATPTPTSRPTPSPTPTPQTLDEKLAGTTWSVEAVDEAGARVAERVRYKFSSGKKVTNLTYHKSGSWQEQIGAKNGIIIKFPGGFPSEIVRITGRTMKGYAPDAHGDTVYYIRGTQK